MAKKTTPPANSDDDQKNATSNLPPDPPATNLPPDPEEGTQEGETNSSEMPNNSPENPPEMLGELPSEFTSDDGDLDPETDGIALDGTRFKKMVYKDIYEPIEEQTMEIIFELPLSVGGPAALRSNLNLVRLSPKQAVALEAVRASADKRQATLSNGNRVVSSPDALRYLLEQISSKIDEQMTQPPTA